MQSTTEDLHEYEMENGARPGHMYKVGNVKHLTTAEENYAYAYTHKVHEVYIVIVFTLVCRMHCHAPLQTPAGGAPLSRWNTRLLLQHNAQGM